MVYRIEIGLKNDVPDAKGTSTIFNAKQSFGLKINNCNVRPDKITSDRVRGSIFFA